MSKRRVTTGLTRLVRTRPVIVVTTMHPDGTVNGGTFGAYTNLSPVHLGVAIGVKSHTYRNLRRTGECGINVLTKRIAHAAEVCGRNIPENTSEISLAGLSLENAEEIAVPLIAECAANLECVYEKEVEVGSHAFVILRCVAGRIEEWAVDVDGGLDPVKAQVIFGVRYPSPLYAVLSEPFVVETDEIPRQSGS